MNKLLNNFDSGYIGGFYGTDNSNNYIVLFIPYNIFLEHFTFQLKTIIRLLIRKTTLAVENVPDCTQVYIVQSKSPK